MITFGLLTTIQKEDFAFVGFEKCSDLPYFIFLLIVFYKGIQGETLYTSDKLKYTYELTFAKAVMLNSQPIFAEQFD